MRSAFLEDADPAAVSQAVRRVLDERGALVREHTSTRIRFTAQAPDGAWSWTRSGYVGVFQRYAERDVEVRLLLRARWPHRIFWGTAAVVLAACLVTVLANLPGTMWFLTSMLGGLALLVATLLYMNTWRAVREEERALMQALEAGFQAGGVATALEQEEARELRDLEAALEAEVERRRVDRDVKAAKAVEKANAPRKRPAFKLRK